MRAALGDAGPRANNFNLLRLLLAALVIVSHSPQMADGHAGREPLKWLFGTLTLGEVAVDGFFMLSGYLILNSWQAQPSAAAFLRKRLLRIVPGYMVAAAVCILVVGPLAADAGSYFSSFWLSGTLFSVLTLGEPTTPAVFAGSAYPAVNGSMWTIRYEFLCYLLVLALGVAGVARRRRWLLPLAVSVPLLFAAERSGLAALAGVHIDGAAGQVLRLAACFATGMVYACRWPRPAWSWRLGAVAALLLCGAMLRIESAEPALLLCGAYLLFSAAFVQLPCLAWAQRMPDASYGTYLYGWPVAKLVLWTWPGLPPYGLTLLALPLAYACGLASWYAVEKPALAFKRRPARPAAVPGVADAAGGR